MLPPWASTRLLVLAPSWVSEASSVSTGGMLCSHSVREAPLILWDPVLGDVLVARERGLFDVGGNAFYVIARETMPPDRYAAMRAKMEALSGEHHHAADGCEERQRRGAAVRQLADPPEIVPIHL